MDHQAGRVSWISSEKGWAVAILSEVRSLSLSTGSVIDRAAVGIGPYVRPIGLAFLMVAEILFLTIRFDPPLGLSQSGWWGIPLIYSHAIIQFFLLFAVMFAVFGGHRLALRLNRAIYRSLDNDDLWQRWLLVHGFCLVILTRLTSFLCEGNFLNSSRPASWVVSILATVATWLAVILPPRAWLEILKRSLRPLTVSLGVTLAAFALGKSANQLWSTMAEATLVLVRGMLKLVATDVSCNASERLIGVDQFQVRIGDPCSGYEGIGLVVAFLAGDFWFFRQSLRWPHSYFLIGLGVVLIWLLNAVRIALLVMIGAWASPSVALGGFHSQAGWLSFLGVSLGLVVVSRRSSFFLAHPESRESEERSNPSMAFLGPFLVVLASSLVTSALSSGFDAFYGLRVLTGGLALWYFRRQYAGLIFNGSWVGVAVGLLAFGLWLALEPASTGSGRALASTVGALPGGRAWVWIALRLIGSVAIVPVVEELAFRGYLIRRLSSVDFQSVPLGRLAWLPLLVSSAAFGLLHGRWIAGMLVGVLYALVLYRRGKLGDAILAHAVTNALIAATVLFTGDWAMWT
jgi:exosortase E/protease (VPEID-CTERM system)